MLRGVFSCLCGKQSALDAMYYCVGCQGMRCFYCVSEEVVSFFCAHCLDNLSSAEVMSNRGRCSKCFECPECGSAAKMVSQEFCFLRCTHCPWDSRGFAVAPSPADLIQVLREQERGGVTATLFKERSVAYVKSCEDAVTWKTRQKQLARARKTQALLVHTPAKKKFFDLAATADKSAGERRERAPLGDGDGISRLELHEEEKNRVLFPQPSEQEKGEVKTAVEPDEVRLPPRHALVTWTSKHCATCDKLLVKPDVSPGNALEFKRLHVAPLFVVDAVLVALSGKTGRATVALYNPMKNPVSVELAPLVDGGVRWTCGAPQSLTMSGAPGKARVKQVVTLGIARTGEGPAAFGITVSIKYEGVLGAQVTKYTARFFRYVPF